MENDNFKNSINEIHEVKMSFDEKSQIFNNIVGFRALAIKSDWSFNSFILLMQRNHLVTYVILFILIFVAGGGVVFDLLSNRNNQINNNNVGMNTNRASDVYNLDNDINSIKNNDIQKVDDIVISSQKIDPPIISKNTDNNSDSSLPPPTGLRGPSLGVGISSSGGSVGSPQGGILSGAWIWDNTTLNNGNVIRPQKKGVFVITFNLDEKVNGQTDCNNFSGSYTIENVGNLNFGPLSMTEMYCQGSEEKIFTNFISKSKSYEMDYSCNLTIFLVDNLGYIYFIKK